MAAAAPVVRKSMAVEVVKERHVLRLKDDELTQKVKKASRRSKKAQIEDLEIGTVVEEAGESTDDATQAISQASSQLLPPLDLNLNRQR
ncbi:hypothetical protein PSTG_01119 [Puccinia striiformis f. sp. tritici PST-78]|uniref:Uncharacterized protein n=1 Tax=Puccinia striiformis f. sp. tritici PST-78 TaxID=1165861 RepID=A0A0L0W2I0_9BASI|nr:hypothetical protein PSTG_01119 [Puccinia striiformis f. sp. tritici PST-78]